MVGSKLKLQGYGKKHGGLFLWLHYVPLLIIVYFVGVKFYTETLSYFLGSLGLAMGVPIFFGITLDAVMMTVWAFLVLALGDMFIHQTFDRVFGWKD
jgi:hypothetical protein